MYRTIQLFLFTLVSFSLFAQEIDFSQFKGVNPRNVGPAGMSGRVTAIDVNLANKDEIFVGTASGGVWKSDNAGVTWEPIFDDVPVQSIGALKINQANPSEIWVGTGEGNPRNSQNAGAGVYHSLDGGKTWHYKGLKETRNIHRIAIDPSNPSTIYIGAQGAQWGKSADRGVYKSMDSGETWDKILYVDEGTGVAEMVMDPSNPNKLIVAMWEFGRTPWFFNSGGPGSGIHMTYDGGKTWKKLSDEDGLPKGDLGRCGLAISASSPDVVYALVEAKENALYKSHDGGHKWTKVSTDENMGNRPFYYAEIYVDPHNPDRVFSLWSYVSRSDDGGKTFKLIADYGNNVHPDHHAFWIDPDNPNNLIDGNDGGMNFSYDMGDNWRFVANLPVGQFYHVDVDDDFPYNIYGGMQDNGTWVGPSFALRSGGITNYDWQEVYFGDGFDAAPKPDNNRYVYAMSQGGNLGLVDKETGVNKFIRPNHPDTTTLRYNWNAALALQPGTDCGLYYGSQFLHYSQDCGQSWTIISPDLTTNDTSKHHQDISGGLTYDATNAENNTCILAIAPSAVDAKVIWVGTDDGRLQITKDGGANWTDVYSKLPGAPKAGWIPQIEINNSNAGEAFVVVNNYRQNDWSAYLYHTADYGVTWRRIVNDNNVSSFLTSVVQDEKEQNLLFLGTDAGLYVSLDKGRSWQKFDEGMPPVQIRDMKIQETFDDLVLGTFGRAFWVIDDIGVFRKLAEEKYVDQDFDLVSVSPGYLSETRSYQGIRFIGQAEFQGDNKYSSPTFSIWMKPESKDKTKRDDKKMDAKKGKKKKKSDDMKSSMDQPKKGSKKKKKEKLHFTILDSSGDTIRRFSRPVKEKGLVRVNWNMRGDGVRGPSRNEPKKDADLPNGSEVLPGIYKVVVKYGDHIDSITTEVKMDPRVEITAEQLTAMKTAAEDYDISIKAARKGFDQIRNAKESIALIKKLSETLEDTESDSIKTEMEDLTKEHSKQLEELELLFFDKENQKGIQRNPNTLSASLRGARRYLFSSYGAPGENAQVAIDKAKSKSADVLGKVDEYFSTQWPEYKKRVEEVQFNLFKE